MPSAKETCRNFKPFAPLASLIALPSRSSRLVSDVSYSLDEVEVEVNMEVVTSALLVTSAQHQRGSCLL